MQRQALHLRVLLRVVPVLSIFLFADCSTVPVTGRQQLTLVPQDQLQSMSDDQYSKVKKEYEVVTGTAESRLVKEVGRDISRATEQYLKEKGEGEEVEGFKWEFTLLKDDDMVNAFAMPGGKVAFFTGMLDVTRDANGLAVVMAHEVAHAVAGHGNERMSQGLLRQLGGVALQIALRDKEQQTRQLFMAAYGAGTTVGVMLPYSRKHESEADELGLYFMAIAGYDPRVAPDFWLRMKKQGGERPPEFLSTHPSPDTRIENLEGWMDKAMEYYRRNQQ